MSGAIPISFSFSSLMIRMRDGGSFLSTLLKDLDRLVPLITAPAGPEMGIIAADAVQLPSAAALPILSSSCCKTLLLEYGSTSNRVAYLRLNYPSSRISFALLSWLGSRVLVMAVVALLKRRPTPLWIPTSVSPGLVTTSLAKTMGLPAWSLSDLRKASLLVICLSWPMAQISCASLRRAPVPVTSKGPYGDFTVNWYMYPSATTGSVTV